MEDYHQRALNKTLVPLVQNFDPDDILHYLIAYEVMTHDDQEELGREPTRKKRVVKFVQILLTKGHRAFECFVKALGEEGTDVHRAIIEELKRNEELTKAEELHAEETCEEYCHHVATSMNTADTAEDFHNRRFRMKGGAAPSRGEDIETLKKYMTKVGLIDYFPGKLTLQDVREVRIFGNDVSRVNPKDIPFLFISKLTSLDSRVVLRANLKILGSMRDFMFALLHCSDAHLRQHIMEKLAACQLAVTVLLPDVSAEKNPVLLRWALRRVVKKWRENESSLAPERRMINQPVFTAAFIRLGDISISKSAVLSNMLGRAQAYEMFQYFLSYEAEKEYVYFANGAVEGQWYLPIHGRDQDIIKEVALLLNLRGDGRCYHRQIQIMCEVSDAIFVFIDKINAREFLHELDRIKSVAPKLFVINITPKQGGKKRIRFGDADETDTRRLEIEADNEIEFRVGSSEIDLAESICHQVDIFRKQTTSYKSIDRWNLISTIVADDENDSYRTAFKWLSEVLPNEDETSINGLKERYLTLQNEWLEWVKADKTPLTSDELTLTEQMDGKEKKKKQLREIQRQKGLSVEMTKLLKYLEAVVSSDNRDIHNYFMNLFQTYIENIVTVEIPPIITQIDKISATLREMSISHTTRVDDTPTSHRKADLQKQLIDASDQFSGRNISCEHFLRELGHLFESTRELTWPERDEHKCLPEIAAKLLMRGSPLELLDGESTYIQIHWIEAVLLYLKRVLDDPKIFVLSIIGIQSSGKSTVLNCMFGVRFPVRSGRCTRGLFLQLVKVNEEFREEFGFEYLFIIDTEGLQSPDRTVKNDYTFDNSVATLAMCIGDLTLLNIGQETIGSDMIGILQIVVHALIRMKKVELVSHCRIIQQRVSDVAAGGNTKANMVNIRAALDKATLAVASEEHVEDIREFSHVFPMVEEGDLQFFPCLWAGAMSPPNTGYSDKIHGLKADIFVPTSPHKKLDPQFTIEKFVRRLRNVWCAVKEEDFVFHFQNSFDALSNQRFRLRHNQLIGQMRTNMVQWELENDISLLTEESKGSFERELRRTIEHERQQIIAAINVYVQEHAEEEEVRRRHQSFNQDTIAIANELKNRIESHARYQLEAKRQLGELPEFLKAAKRDLKRAAQEKARDLREKTNLPNFSEDKTHLNKTFDQLWKGKWEKLESKYLEKRISNEDIETSCENSLTNLMNGTSHNRRYLKAVEMRKNGKWVSIFSRSSKKFKQFYANRDKVDMKFEVEKIIQRSIEIFELHGNAKPFNRMFVDQVITHLYNEMKKKEVIDEFVVDALLIAITKITSACQRNQLQHEEAFSLTQLFEAEECQLRKDFLGYFDDTIKTEAAAERIFSQLLSACRELVINDLNVKLLVKMRQTNCFIDKQLMLGEILEELCQLGNPEKYYDFIQHYDQFVGDWLREKVVALVISNGAWLREVVVEKILLLLQTICTAQINTTSKLQQAQEEGCVQLDSWITEFLSHTTVIESLSVDVGIIDLVTFTDKLGTLLTGGLRAYTVADLVPTLPLNEHTAENILLKMKKDVAINLLQHLRGCEARCPFCKVGCQLQGTGHYHTAAFHYSPGLAGFRFVESERLVDPPCTMLVASPCSYRFSAKESYRYYKDYTREFPEWRICPSVGDEPVNYWKWVFANFNEFFAKSYGAKPAKLPHSWSDISKQAASANLRECYSLAGQDSGKKVKVGKRN